MKPPATRAGGPQGRRLRRQPKPGNRRTTKVTEIRERATGKMSIATDYAAEAGRRRASLLASVQELSDLGPDTIDDGPLTHQLRAPHGLDHEGRLAWLDAKAAAWGVRPVNNAMGRHAEWRAPSGGLRLLASVADTDRSVSGHKDRFAAMQAANGMGATA